MKRETYITCEDCVFMVYCIRVFRKVCIVLMIKRKTLTYVILTLLLLTSFVSSATSVFSSTVEDIKNQINNAGNKQDSIQSQLDKVSGALADKQKEYEKYSKEYAQLAKDYENGTSDLQKRKDEIENLFREMEELQKTIDEKEAEYRTALDLFYQRALLTYKYSGYSALKMYVESGNVFDYKDRLRLMQDMMASDKETMEELMRLKKDLDAKKSLVEITTLDLEQAAKEKENLLNQIKDTQSNMEHVLTVSRDAIKRLEAQEAALEAESKRIEAELRELQWQYEKMLGQHEGELRFMWPAPKGKWISSYYGYRTHPITGQWKMHSGIDIPANGGTPIIASESGVVATVAWDEGGYGWYCIVYHGDGYSTLYAHSSKILVKVGDKVQRGQTIALVGTTGGSTGNHLHFEVRLNGATKNPLDYVSLY